MKKNLNSRLVNICVYTILIILLIMPFHEFITTWLASNFGHVDLFRIWKEIILLIITPIPVYLALKDKKIKQWLLEDKLPILIYIFVLLCIVMGILGYVLKHVNLLALAAGLIIDLRFLLIFLITLVLTQYSDFFKKFWRQILVYPAIIVILFGLAQLFLPSEFLSHFGYGKGTIPALETLDGNMTIQRVQSFLRGANPLGAYLLLITPIFCFFSTKKRLVRIVFAVLSIVVLFFTYSRSAYIGMIVTIGIMFYFLVFKKIKYVNEHKKMIYYLLGIFSMTFLLVTVMFRNNTTFQDIVFHNSKNSGVRISSDQARTSFLKINTRDFILHPLGQGVGVAGPASMHNNKPPKIAENFYIQIGQETGVIGLALFLTINIIVGYRLYLQHSDQLSLLLFASLVGISIINMVSHAWADDTLSLIWWSFAGVALSPKLHSKSSRIS